VYSHIRASAAARFMTGNLTEGELGAIEGKTRRRIPPVASGIYHF
jgi:hypothetical protein